MLLTKVLYSCSHAASLLYSFLFSYSGFQNFSMSSLVDGSMMVILFSRSSSKSFDCLFIKSLFCWYCFFLLWYLESLLLKAYRRYLSVSSEVDLVCSSTIWYFVFIEFVFLFIFGEGLGSFICDISMRLIYLLIHIECPSPFLPLTFFDDTLIFDTRSFNRGNCCSVNKLWRQFFPLAME